MPKLHVFDMREPGDWERWLAWRQMVACRETWGAGGARIGFARWVYRTRMQASLVKQAWWSVDKRLFVDKAVTPGLHFLAIWWADDNYWAILPALTKGD